MYLYSSDRGRQRIFPYLILLWSGYYSASLSVSAFALLNRWLSNAIAAFGALIFTCVLGLTLGIFAGRLLARRRLYVQRLISLLAAASLLSGAPIVYGDSLAAFLLQSGISRDGATILIACLLFAPPLLLLSALPPYAAAMLIRHRGSAGSVSDATLLNVALGYSVGVLTTVYYLTWEDPRIVLKGLFFLSLILILTALLGNPPHKLRGRR